MYKVAIQNNKTREIRVFEDQLDWQDHFEFWWTEGNMSCDCNLFLCFERAAGNKPDSTEGKCNEEIYTALYAELPDGRRIPLDHY